jgi:hypothetical protein
MQEAAAGGCGLRIALGKKKRAATGEEKYTTCFGKSEQRKKS